MSIQLFDQTQQYLPEQFQLLPVSFVSGLMPTCSDDCYTKTMGAFVRLIYHLSQLIGRGIADNFR